MDIEGVEMYALILAGGSGSRLWPLSRELYPKQLISLHGKDSLLQSTCKRLDGIVESENTICITNVKHANDVKYQLRQIDSSCTVLSEPMGKNTAPAIASALQYIKNMAGTDDTVIILPSDHLVQDVNAFAFSVKSAQQAIAAGRIVTFGIKPSYPETGFGYIKTLDEKYGCLNVSSFVEKPDIETAKKYLQDGCYYWNSGIFAGKISVILDEFSKHAPEIYKYLDDLDFSKGLNIPYGVYENMPQISFDYAIMEKTDKASMVVLKSDWNDLGSWKSVYDLKEKDLSGNVLEGNVIADNVKNSLIYSSKKLVAVSGLEDIILVETEDAIMACKKDQSHDVKNLYDRLEKENVETKTVHKTVFRPWGYYTCLAEGDGYLTKVISVSPKHKLSIQSHNHRSEHWVVLEGRALVILDGKENHLRAGQSIDIPLKAKHSLQNPYDEELRIIEVQKGDYISEDDIIRYEDAYGRV